MRIPYETNRTVSNKLNAKYKNRYEIFISIPKNREVSSTLHMATLNFQVYQRTFEEATG